MPSPLPNPLQLLPSQAPLAYRQDIDGLRALAVSIVVCFHAFPNVLSGGFVGVDIFFVISGFLISGIIFQEIEIGVFSFAHFYARRVRRIFPALLIVLAVTFAIGWTMLWADELRQLSKHILGAIGFALNLMLSSETGYFDAAADTKPLLHLWSLGVEEQYYIIWPPIIFALRKRPRALALVIISIAAISFIFNVARTHDHGAATFFLPTGRIWELLIGAWLAHRLIYPEHPIHLQARKFCSQVLRVSPDVLNATKSAFGLAIIVGSALLLDPGKPFPGWLALLPTTGGYLIISAGPMAPVNLRLLSHPAAILIGLISYPLYLWHWPLLVYARIIAAGPPDPSVRAAAVLLSLVFAWMTYQLLERPIRARGGLEAVCTLVGAGAMMAGLALVVYLTHGLPSRFGEIATSSNLMTEFDAARDKYTKCTGDLAGTEELTWCLASQNGPPKYAIFGDSHADHLFPGIAAVDTENWLLIGQTSCPPALDVRAYFDGAPEDCLRKNAAALAIIARQPSISIVILSFLGPYYISDEGFAAGHVGRWSPDHYHLQSAQEIGGSKREVLEQGLRRTVEALQSASKQVVFYLDVPEMPSVPADCVARWSLLGQPARCAVSRDIVAHRQADYRDMIFSISRDYPEVRVFDPLSYLCGDVRCELAPGGRPNYRDSHHLSLRGSVLLAAPFLQWLRPGVHARTPAEGF